MFGTSLDIIHRFYPFFGGHFTAFLSFKTGKLFSRNKNQKIRRIKIYVLSLFAKHVDFKTAMVATIRMRIGATKLISNWVT